MNIRLGLDTIRELLDRLGNPEDKLKVIHVAGTNGKGSTIAMLSAILKEAKYRVGKYTSPAVFNELEMYQIDNENITSQDYHRISMKVSDIAESMAADGYSIPTKFEKDTAIAYTYLAEMGCDIAIIETGMGGDSDATNVCEQVLASVITAVSLDHTSFLGATVEEIASHKAGIIKKGCPVVVSEQSEAVLNVIETRAKEMEAKYVVAGKAGSKYDLQSEGIREISLSLKGVYQRKNAVTVMEVIDILREEGYHISDQAIYKGLSNVKWPGRFETISHEPFMIIDGAHNPGAVLELQRTLEEEYAHYKYVFIMGVLADKDYSTQIDMIARMATQIITVTPNNARALSSADLARAVSQVNGNVIAAETVSEAVNIAVDTYNSLEGDRLILAFGSLSYMSEMKDVVEKICR